MTELRQRMLDAMVQRGFALATQQTYVSAIRRMAKHYRRDPATYTVQEVQAYLLHMVKNAPALGDRHAVYQRGADPG
jgi:integrase/recombinase XerD